MSHFTQEQLKELATFFNLPMPEAIPEGARPIKDGYAFQGQELWWRGEFGPEKVNTNFSSHWKNLQEYPELYSHTKPMVKTVIYGD